MKKRREKILNIKERLNEVSNLFGKHGINPEHDIFIKEELNGFIKELEEIENDINDEKK
jgi:hypothetical protein